MDVLEAIRTRRSIGKLAGDVGRDEIDGLVEAAVWAPNHRLTRPWTFTIVCGEARDALGATWAALQGRRTTLDGAERDAYLEREARKPSRAPTIVVASTRTVADPIVAMEDYAATAAAVQNLLLAAHARGLGAIWRTGAMAYAPEINEHLGLDRTDRIVAFVYVGRPAMAAPKSVPRDVTGVLRVL